MTKESIKTVCVLNVKGMASQRLETVDDAMSSWRRLAESMPDKQIEFDVMPIGPLEFPVRLTTYSFDREINDWVKS